MTIRPLRDRQIKIRLTADEAAELKSRAHKHELSQADFIRLLTLGQTAYGLPNVSKLQAICQQLAGIGANLNQCQKSINEAKASGVLNDQQFNAMYRAIAEGRRLWLEPLDGLRAELRKLRPAQ